jgi:hypothetical protein
MLCYTQKLYDPNKKIISVVNPQHAINILPEFNILVSKYGIEAAINKMLKTYPTLVTLETEKIAGDKIIKLLSDLEFDYDEDRITKESYEYKKNVYKQFIDSIGSNYVLSQIGDVAITIGAHKAFGYNPVPPITNLAFGIAQILSHSAGGQDFTISEGIAGVMNAIASLKNTVSDGSRAENKLYNFIKRYKILPENYGGDAGSTKYNMNALTPLGALSASDYILRAGVTDSILHNTKVIDKNGIERSVFEAYNNDGSWNVEEFGENNDWGADSGSLVGNKELLSLIKKINYINQMLHGNMAKETTTMIKRHILGRMISQYRMSWLADSVYARFGKKKYVGALGRDVEGTYRTMFNFVGQEGVIPGVAKLTKIFAKLLLFQGESSFDGIKILKKDRELFMANIRKQFFEIKTMLILYGAYLLLSASLDDDDKESKKWKYMMLNISNKVIQDITFYINPISFKTTTDNLVPAFGLLLDVQKFGSSMAKHLSNNPYYTDENVNERFFKMFPYLNVYYKIRDRSEGEIQNK